MNFCGKLRDQDFTSFTRLVVLETSFCARLRWRRTSDHARIRVLVPGSHLGQNQVKTPVDTGVLTWLRDQGRCYWQPFPHVLEASFCAHSSWTNPGHTHRLRRCWSQLQVLAYNKKNAPPSVRHFSWLRDQDSASLAVYQPLVASPFG